MTYGTLHQTIDISLDMESTKTLSPLYFGDNLEHTRDCVNSGISAQMLKNRKFVGLPDRFGCALSWYRIGEKTSFAYSYLEAYTRHYEGYRMVRAHECNAQRITAFIPGIAGIGQGGLTVTEGTDYEFVLTAKVFSPMAVSVSLIGSNGDVLDRKELSLCGYEYASYSATLTPCGSDTDARLEITFCEAGTLTLGAVSLMPADHFHGMRRDVIALMKQMGIRLLRWPGGNFSGEYYWKDGLMPRDQRAPFQSYLWVETQPHTWGYDYHEINTDDFLALCHEIGAEPFITINPTWTTPQDNADWVEYCNGDASTPYGRLRAENGHPEPYGVKCWSLGNEFGYGHMEGANGPKEYAAEVRKHGEKMLSVDPGLRLCSCGPYPNEEWAKESAKALADISRVVSLHHYATYPEYVDPDKREQDYYTFISTPDTEYLPRMQQLREQLPDDVTISYDEWNAWVAWYRPGSITEGIFAARLLNMMYMNAEKYGVSQICHFEASNEGAILVYPDRAVLTPAGQAIAAMRHHAGGIIRAIQDDVIATETDGILTLTLINRSYDRDKAFTFPKAGTVFSATLLSGDGVLPYSTFNETQPDILEENGSFRTVLPEHSIAVIRLQR
jgi:alpha-N-arabinofuranosidase